MASQRQTLAPKRCREDHQELFPVAEQTPWKIKLSTFKRKKSETNGIDPNKVARKSPKRHLLRVPSMKPGQGCFICKDQDHIAKLCLEKSQWEKNKICLLGRRKGHSLKHCPNKDDASVNGKMCYNCGETAISLASCPHPLQHVESQERPRPQVTKFVSEDDFLTDKKDAASSALDSTGTEGGHAKAKKKQGTKIINFVG